MHIKKDDGKKGQKLVLIVFTLIIIQETSRKRKREEKTPYRRPLLADKHKTDDRNLMVESKGLG
jgi:hypothetical protein